MELTGHIFNIQKFSINDGPGIRTTVFFQGCPLACRWCANPESQNRYAVQAQLLNDDRCRRREVTVDQVMAEVLQDKPFYDQSGGGMTLSGGEVLSRRILPPPCAGRPGLRGSTPLRRPPVSPRRSISGCCWRRSTFS